jgi:hypothetical protein
MCLGNEGLVSCGFFIGFKSCKLRNCWMSNTVAVFLHHCCLRINLKVNGLSHEFDNFVVI